MARGGSTSRSLLARAGADDAEAWDRLVALYAPLVMYWCRRWDVPEADVSDIFQEVFRTVATRLGAFRRDRPGDTFRGWLRAITRSRVCDYYRRAEREPRGVGGTDVQIRMGQVPDTAHVEADEGDDGDEEAAHNALVHRALEQIRPQFQRRTWQAFWAVTVDGRPTADVADELSMSVGAVRVAKSRVLQRLREELGEVL